MRLFSTQSHKCETNYIFKANSFLEIGQHIGVYRQVVGIIREMCHQPSLRSLLAPLPDQHTSIQELLHNLEQQANIMIQRIGKIISRIHSKRVD